MKIAKRIKDEKGQYDIDTEAVNISAVSCGKLDNYEYLTSEKMSLDQNRIKEQVRFTHLPLGKT